MSHLSWFDQKHLKRIQNMFPKSRGVGRVDDRRVSGGIIRVIRAADDGFGDLVEVDLDHMGVLGVLVGFKQVGSGQSTFTARLKI